jgi:CHAT domain-containing protein
VVEVLTRAVDQVNAKGNLHWPPPRLLFSGQEAARIFDLAGGHESRKATGFDASLALAISPALSEYRIVHFATHGLINSQNPQLSGLLLSLVDEKGQPRPGYLSVRDIYNLQLPAELIVLSACQTALGKQMRGEGIVGLTRGFLYAGAKRVVASLWNVDDSATAELMQWFYEGMLREKRSPAAALRLAQLRLLRQSRTAPPYYWAAFSVHGEW